MSATLFASDHATDELCLPIGAVLTGKGFEAVIVRCSIEEYLDHRFVAWLADDLIPRAKHITIEINHGR